MNTVGKVLIQALILFFSISENNAQTIQWANHIGSTGFDGATNGVCDKEGNFYLPGVFEGPFCHFQTGTLTCKGASDVFLVKYGKDGEEQWVKRFGGDNPESVAEGMKIFYDSVSNHLYLLGTFFGTVQFGNNLFFTSTDLILAKYTLDGECVWAKQFGGEGTEHHAGITVNSTGDIFICGETNDYIIFGADTVSPGGFLARFDHEGNCIWAKKKFSYENYSMSSLRMTGISVFDSTLLISGSLDYNDTISIDTIRIHHPGYCSCIIVFFDLNGNASRVIEGIAVHTETNANLVLDQGKNIYFTGHFNDSILFDTLTLTSSTGEYEMFLVKYDKSGNFQWARQAVSDKAEGNRVFANLQGYSYVTGTFSGSAEFDGNNVTAYSPEDLFLARYTPGGQCMGVAHYPNGVGWGIAGDSEDNAIVTFLFQTSTSVGDSTFLSYGDKDILVFKSGPITSTKESPAGPSDKLLIYANPTTGKCNITIPDEFKHEKELTLYIYDSQGRLVQQAAIKEAEGTYRLDIRAQAAGIYQAVLSNGAKQYSGKIVFAKND